MIAKETLPRMVVFAAVVDEGSLSGAARRIGLTRSAVSRQLAVLEQQLAVRLLNRTTRSLSLTEAGQAFYRSCVRIREEAEAAERSVRSLAEHPVGTLRVTAPVIGHRLIMPVVSAYLGQYPDVRLDITFDDRYVDLVGEGYDVGVRIGRPADSSLVARQLMPVEHVVVAAPDYLERRGVPLAPSDLADHDWIAYSLISAPNRLTLRRLSDGEPASVRLNSRLMVNGGPATRDALLAGLGLASMPAFFLSEELQTGRLLKVLQDHQVDPSRLYAVFPHRQHLPTKVRAFVDLLVSLLGKI